MHLSTSEGANIKVNQLKIQRNFVWNPKKKEKTHQFITQELSVDINKPRS